MTWTKLAVDGESPPTMICGLTPLFSTVDALEGSDEDVRGSLEDVDAGREESGGLSVTSFVLALAEAERDLALAEDDGREGDGDAEGLLEADRGFGDAEWLLEAGRGVGDAEWLLEAEVGVGDTESFLEVAWGVGDAEWL